MTDLVAIVSVEFAARILCQNPGCGHAVYRRIHVVNDAGQWLLLGSTCFAKLYGSEQALGAPRVGNAEGKTLSAEEREQLLANTEEFMRSLEDLARPRIVNPPPAPPAPPQRSYEQTYARPAASNSTSASPWPWRKPMSSMARFNCGDGTLWYRVQHTDGRHLLMPWPQGFEGWDESLPALIGMPHETIEGLVVSNVATAVAYLTQMTGGPPKVSGLWRDLAP